MRRWGGLTGLAASLVLAAMPIRAADRAPLSERVAAVLRSAGPGTRFGLVVTDMAGREIVVIAPDDRFVPASNTKIFTTLAAYDALPGIDQPDVDGGAAVRLEPHRAGPPDVVLVGHGDARLSSAATCAVDCLATLADAVAARTRQVGDVIGDDSLYPDERWSPGMSWNNIPTRSGTGVSALTLDDNEWPITVKPGATLGAAPIVAAIPYYTIDDRAVTGTTTALSYDRRPGDRQVRIAGSIALGAAAEVLRLGIDDPADYAASRLAALLRERGVRVTGGVTVRHRPLSGNDDPVRRGTVPPASAPPVPPLAQLTPAPLAEDVRITNKVSQNLHAELLLRRLGRVRGSGSIADGQAMVRAMLDKAGVERWRYDLADGSGMSSYNRVSPRGMVRLLRWSTRQPWAAAWRATLPIGGVDGTLRRRFAGTPLERRLFAKTGSLDKASALSGFMVAASGRTLIFASYANDMPGDAAVTKAVDAALLLIAAES